MKRVLVTGATGVIGSEVALALMQSKDCEVQLLLRAKSPEHLAQRLSGLFGYWQGMSPEDRYRIRAIAGDVCLPRLGVDPTEYNRLSASVSHVIHCAGNVKLNQSREEAHANAVQAAANVLEFARVCQVRGCLRKVDAVTTIGVAGSAPGRVPERRLARRRFHNTYEAAKAEAEELLFRAIDEGLPVTVHRPSMTVGNSKTGRVLSFQVFYYVIGLLLGEHTFGFVPIAPDVLVDLVPVDFVAQAIRLSSDDPEAAGKVFHLCSGEEKSLSLAQLSDRLRDIYARLGAPTRSARKVSYAFVRAPLRLISRAGGSRIKTLRSVPFLMDYLDSPQIFENSNTLDYLSRAGLKLPHPDEYLGKIVEYYWKSVEAKKRVKRSVCDLQTEPAAKVPHHVS